MEISLAVSFYQCEWAQKSDIIYWTSFINIEEISTKMWFIIRPPLMSDEFTMLWDKKAKRKKCYLFSRSRVMGLGTRTSSHRDNKLLRSNQLVLTVSFCSLGLWQMWSNSNNPHPLSSHISLRTTEM